MFGGFTVQLIVCLWWMLVLEGWLIGGGGGWAGQSYEVRAGDVANGARLWVFQQMEVNSVLCLIVHNGIWCRGLGYIRCVCVCAHTHIHTHTHTYVYIYIYIMYVCQIKSCQTIRYVAIWLQVQWQRCDYVFIFRLLNASKCLKRGKPS